VVVYLGDVRLTSFYGILGISVIPYYVSIVFSIVTIVFIINAFNLIDGVNWLAGGVSLVVSSSFGAWFYTHGYYDYSIMSACIFGAILAFLKFNYSPAKIFLGDSGSLSLGLLTATMAIEFIELSSQQLYTSSHLPYYVTSGPAMAIAILIIPIFDTLRVFTLRILHKKSPFSPDRNHHHHRLLDLGFTHEQTSAILIITNIVFIFLTYLLQFLRSAYLIPIIFSVAFIISYLLFHFKLPEKSLTKHPII
jgi:UDP-N-acetylmuramyl pentapeptide phosphotransferase/UDP-N-acetylglucosamine-1-phosphate transferase